MAIIFWPLVLISTKLLNVSYQYLIWAASYKMYPLACVHGTGSYQPASQNELAKLLLFAVKTDFSTDFTNAQRWHWSACASGWRVFLSEAVNLILPLKAISGQVLSCLFGWKIRLPANYRNPIRLVIIYGIMSSKRIDVVAAMGFNWKRDLWQVNLIQYEYQRKCAKRL